jgi:hypothetical protein
MAGHILADEIVEHVYAIDVDLIERMDIRRPDTTLVHDPVVSENSAGPDPVIGSGVRPDRIGL